METTNEEKPICPKCGKQYPIFDGHDCRLARGGCGFARSARGRKSHGKMLSPEEATEARSRILGEAEEIDDN